MIKRDIGSSCLFSGGNEDTVRVDVVSSAHRNSEKGEKQLIVSQYGGAPRLSLQTMKDIIVWAEEDP